MKTLRTLLSALFILAGATLVVAWLLSWMAINLIEDGAATESVVVVALESPAVVDRIGTEVKDQAFDALADRGIDLDVWGVGDAAADSLTSLAQTDEFRDAVLDQVQTAREQLHDELTDPDRPRAPFDIAIDASELINDRIDELTGAVVDVPSLSVAPVRIEVVSADTFEKVRTGYARVEFAKKYFLWAGLAFIVLGLLVSTRKRFVIAKFLAAVGVFCLIAYAALTLVGPAGLSGWLPDGGDESWGTVFADLIAEDALPAITGRLLLASGLALAGAAVATLLGFMAGGSRR